MKSLIICAISYVGKVLGYISFIFAPPLVSIKYSIYKLLEGFSTVRNKYYFNEFGKGSIIAPSCSFCHAENICVGKFTTFNKFCILETTTIDSNLKPIVRIGDNCNFGDYTHITSANKIVIGDGLLTGRFVLISDNSHGNITFEESEVMPISRPVVSSGSIYIGKNVWLGDNVKVLANVSIGDGAIIGAGSVVTKNIPPYSVAVGNPAKVIKQLN